MSHAGVDKTWQNAGFWSLYGFQHSLRHYFSFLFNLTANIFNSLTVFKKHHFALWGSQALGFSSREVRNNGLTIYLLHLQSGPKVLDHWGVITNDFPRSPFSMLIHIVLARTPLLSATLKQGVGRGNCIWIQGLGVTIPLKNRQKINVRTVNGWMKLKRERRSNDFWPWL